MKLNNCKKFWHEYTYRRSSQIIVMTLYYILLSVKQQIMIFLEMYGSCIRIEDNIHKQANVMFGWETWMECQNAECLKVIFIDLSILHIIFYFKVLSTSVWYFQESKSGFYNVYYQVLVTCVVSLSLSWNSYHVVHLSYFIFWSHFLLGAWINKLVTIFKTRQTEWKISMVHYMNSKDSDQLSEVLIIHCRNFRRFWLCIHRDVQTGLNFCCVCIQEYIGLDKSGCLVNIFLISLWKHVGTH